MGIKHNYTATGTNDGAKQVSVDRWNADHVIDAELDLPLVTPAAPAADTISIFGKKVGGRMMAAQMGPSGLDTSLQANLGGNRVALWLPPGNGTVAPGIFGMAALTVVSNGGTSLNSRTCATTNIATRAIRTGVISTATAGILGSLREAAAKYTTGAGAGIGGFFYRLRFVPSNAAAVSGERFFAGMWSQTTAATNQEPTAMTNCVGICQLSTSTNLQIYGAGASVGTAVDLGVNFPGNGLSTDLYELSMFASPSGTVYWQVDRIGTAYSSSGTFAAAPSSTTLLCSQMWKCNNTTALAVAFDVVSLYIETDN